MKPYYEAADIVLYHGDCRAVMGALADNSISSIVCDPPYGLEFMGKEWDRLGAVVGVVDDTQNRDGNWTTKPFGGGGNRVRYGKSAASMQNWHKQWATEALRVLKPGSHLLAFGGTRTYHRLACAIEDAGFEVRDTICWLYGSGFPKSLNVSKAIDREAGAQREVVGMAEYSAPDIRGNSSNGRGISSDASKQAERLGVAITAPSTDAAKQWDGWGTALKPAMEPVVVARKPLAGTVAQNVQTYGAGALNIDGCRVPVDASVDDMLREVNRVERESETWRDGSGFKNEANSLTGVRAEGRWPANCIHDGSDEVLAEFAKAGETISRASPANNKPCGKKGAVLELSQWENRHTSGAHHGDSGTAARFFYCAKASRRERGDGNNHPTVKPRALMAYLCRLVTPPGGTILDPFAGSGTTLLAARLEGMKAIGIEREEAYCEIIVRRLEGRCGAKAKSTTGTSRELSLFD